MDGKFRLTDSFLDKYKRQKPPFGFNGLGALVYLRTYSRLKANGDNERWWETIQRVVEGTFNMQKVWIEQHKLGWNSIKAQKSAQEMYDRMFNMKFLPPGRGLWSMGSPITEERHLYAALNNCAFVSTSTIKEDVSKSFCFLMDMSMLGVGVGFDCKGSGKIKVGKPSPSPDNIYKIADTREGWVESTKLLIESYLLETKEVHFDYSLIRAAGEPIKGFGGVSSGSQPLIELHKTLRVIFDKNVGHLITTTTIVDVMNLIGKCVVAGNVRRTAEIVFGDYNSEEYLDLKNYKKNPHRSEYGWTSNNSIFCDLGMDYSNAAERTKVNGEPGYAWLENMKGYSRMNNGMDHKDHRVEGGNPCLTGDTLIAVADGRNAVSIKELAEEGNDVAVYSMNKSGMVEIKWGRNPRKTRENAELVEIEFEEGGKLRVTPDHKMILLNGETCRAKDLKIGDSLPRFQKRKEKMFKDNPNKYYIVSMDTNDVKRKREMEHRLIVKFHNPEKWNELYNESKSNGWCKGGIVVHHKDYNGLNNSIDNLELMTFKDHCKFHADHDNQGENNPMFGRQHTEESKKLIGEKTKERCKDVEYLKRLSNSHTDECRELYSSKMKKNKKEWDKEYYIEQSKKTDLETVWVNERMFAKKKCITCNDEMIVSWGSRHVVFCSHSCQNKHEGQIKFRKEGQKIHFENKQRDTLHQQIMIFKDLKQSLDRNPLKKEWERECRNRKISFRIRNPESLKTENPYVLKSYKELIEKEKGYNHRVKSVTFLSEKEDVYNITVDDNYNYSIITQVSDNQVDGIIIINCLEQSLESYELCCLVETFPNNHENLDDFLVTLKYAYLYAKTVTLGQTHWPETNRVMLRNRRIGCSMSGIVQFLANRGIDEFKTWCEKGYKKIEYYDEVYSDWLAIPKSIKKTSIKPSGTVSLVAGATPGVHFPENVCYIRRMRLSKYSDLVGPLKEAGYHIEDCKGSEDTTVVVEIPVKIGDNLRPVKDVSIWEQAALAAFLQRYWADNQVSCTISFRKDEANQIKHLLNFYQYQLKGISFLPITEKGAYEQMPYETISIETYDELSSKLKPVRFKGIKHEEADVERFCSNDVCEIKPKS